MRRFAHLLGILFLLGSSVAAAKGGFRGKPQDYVEPDDAEQARAAARARARSKLHTFVENEEDQAPATAFPWKQLLATLAAFGVAVPFGWSYYKQQAGEFSSPDRAKRPGRVLKRRE